MESTEQAMLLVVSIANQTDSWVNKTLTISLSAQLVWNVFGLFLLICIASDFRETLSHLRQWGGNNICNADTNHKQKSFMTVLTLQSLVHILCFLNINSAELWSTESWKQHKLIERYCAISTLSWRHARVTRCHFTVVIAMNNGPS